jgi:hypothetical protein
LRAFAGFWWEFAVGDDWRLTIGLVLALAVTTLLRHSGVPVWWLLPAAAGLLLFSSLRRAARHGHSK